jgi:hypothetical protein
MEERELKALEIAAKSKLTRRGKTWLVPSQSVRGAQYTVNSILKNQNVVAPTSNAESSGANTSSPSNTQSSASKRPTARWSSLSLSK